MSKRYEWGIPLLMRSLHIDGTCIQDLKNRNLQLKQKYTLSLSTITGK